ncbi:MAG: transglutaminase domain-containing protein [Blautia sp.]|nr:transglutaminase domain-containing protein [Blautia sp.]
MSSLHKRWPALFLAALFLFLCGCGGSRKPAGADPPVYSPPRVLVPEFSFSKSPDSLPLLLDLSKTDNGYLAAKNNSADKKVNLQLASLETQPYSYFLSPGELAFIPFTEGNGEYILTCYLQASSDRYAALYSQNLDVKVKNEFYPFLYPNQYVNFTPESKACKTALSMMEENTPDTQALEQIYNLVVDNVKYDTHKAETVPAGYLPDIDETLRTGEGICFDYAALMAAMLRARDIPCRLQIGYAGTTRHAWIDVYLRSAGWINKAIQYDGNVWSRLDPTFDSNPSDKEEIRAFIGDGTNYTVQFTR